ncbi:hypothetical protein JL193_09060 [Polaribacter batillariae]|uniref:Uncharacterized protein n=1 Tax=Polaribacter batillariae TaxID=2808900 RepID=A0ABX7STZ0_9FLAO|nr:hypothetical protein [Polaribacter batillariae]QTD36314.1 hypothetical protein JL193_09060 [Polaribacter batillariae]
MDNLIKIDNRIYGIDKLSQINDKIINWNFEEIKGIGFCRKHDSYAHIEFRIFEYQKEDFYDFIKWEVSSELLPDYEKSYGIEILNNYCSFLKNYITGLKGINTQLVFEITNAGFHPTDRWWKVVGYAFIQGFISCFDNELFEKNKKKSEDYFKKINEIKDMVKQLNSV